MKKLLLPVALILAVHTVAQPVSKRLREAYVKFENDPQLSNALASLYVIDAKTGAVVFDRNSRIGLATASTLKVITAATAYELLGRDFRYETKLAYNGKIEDGMLKGDLFLIGDGDPTFGSWRYAASKMETLMNEMISQLKLKKISRIDGDFYLDESRYSFQPLPDGWIWQDIGNYYGAGTWAINWNENQYDLVLKPGKKVGDTTAIVKMIPAIDSLRLYNQIRTGERGSGDNGYIYLPPYSFSGFTEGTIPLQEPDFSISGAMYYPAVYLAHAIERSLKESKIDIKGGAQLYAEKLARHRKWPGYAGAVYTHYSPSMDSIVYWFLKKSINLYGEALIKTIALQKNGFGETEKGVTITKKFWQEKGIASTELNMVDGSGLSPLNRITTHAQVMVLKYAVTQPWFNGYSNAFPEFNGMKMKSGTINGVKGFCGYHQSKAGNHYIFSFLVNNYNGPATSVVQKMYKVLDELK